MNRYSMIRRAVWPTIAVTLFLAPFLLVAAKAQEKGLLVQVSANLNQAANAELEPSVAINPANPNNIAAVWFAINPDIGSEAIVAGVTFDGCVDSPGCGRMPFTFLVQITKEGHSVR